jgi:hypothetical protein
MHALFSASTPSGDFFNGNGVPDRHASQAAENHPAPGLAGFSSGFPQLLPIVICSSKTSAPSGAGALPRPDGFAHRQVTPTP